MSAFSRYLGPDFIRGSQTIRIQPQKRDVLSTSTRPPGLNSLDRISSSGRALQRTFAVDVDVDAASPESNPPSQGYQPEISIESVRYENGSFHVCGTMKHPAPRSVVYDTLVDYDALPRIFHNVDSCSVRRCHSGKLVVTQMVGWKFLIFRGAFETELEVVEDGEGRLLTFSLLKSAFMREFVGDWEVVDEADGSFTRHELSVMPMVRPPQRIGNITAKIFETQVKCVLKDLADELSDRIHRGGME